MMKKKICERNVWEYFIAEIQRSYQKVVEKHKLYVQQSFKFYHKILKLIYFLYIVRNVQKVQIECIVYFVQAKWRE